jgi:uncharacterized membrane protein YdjX (TVP38/TMEM64 family)
MAGDGGWRAAAALLLVALLLAGAMLLWWEGAPLGFDQGAPGVADVVALVRGWGRWGWAASIGLMVLHSFLPLPAEVIPLANGMLYGAPLGVALTWSGAMLGAALSFALARGLGRPFVRLVAGERAWRRVESVSPTPGTLIFVRLVPLISFNLVNYAAGVLGVPWWRFLWTTALGILPLTVVMVVMGNAMLAAPLWAWLAAALALVALWLLWQGWQRRRARPPLPR